MLLETSLISRKMVGFYRPNALRINIRWSYSFEEEGETGSVRVSSAQICETLTQLAYLAHEGQATRGTARAPATNNGIPTARIAGLQLRSKSHRLIHVDCFGRVARYGGASVDTGAGPLNSGSEIMGNVGNGGCGPGNGSGTGKRERIANIWVS